MTDLDDVARLAAGGHGLAVVSTARSDGTIQSSVVNAGVLPHPVTRVRVLGFVAGGGTRKLANLRSRPTVTVVVQAEWRWAAVEGTATIIGPDDPADGIDGEALRLLLHEVFIAADGRIDDFEWVMAEERPAAVFVTPRRIYGYP
jgi:PPOX class probable F420-dependent enzyme